MPPENTNPMPPQVPNIPYQAPQIPQTPPSGGQGTGLAKIIAGFIVAGVVIGGGYWFYQSKSDNLPSTTQSTSTTVESNNSNSSPFTQTSSSQEGGDCGLVMNKVDKMTSAESAAVACLNKAAAKCVPASLSYDINKAKYSTAVLGKQGGACEVSLKESNSSPLVVCRIASSDLASEVAEADKLEATSEHDVVFGNIINWRYSGAKDAKLFYTGAPITCTEK